MTLKPSTPFYRANIIQMTTSVWRKLNIQNVLKVHVFFTTTLLAQLYVRVDIIPTCEKHFHDPEYGTALTTIIPILFLYLNTVTVTAGTFEP